MPFHFCPVEAAAFVAAMPFVKWLIGCCIKCCTKHIHTQE